MLITYGDTMKPLKTLFALTAIATAMIGCGNDNKKSQTVSQPDPLKPITAITDLGVACVEVSLAETDESKHSTLNLSVVDTYVSGANFLTSAAEIVSYDDCSDRLYVVNAQDATVDVLMLSNEGELSKTGTINLNLAATKAGVSIAAANSVVAKHGVVAVAIENANKQANGLIGLYRSDDLSLIEVFEAGALPDMVNMTNNGRYIIVANEGEPNADYSVDPEGSITIVDLNDGLTANNAVIKPISFTSLNTQVGVLKADGVRLPMPMGASVAQDLEPEYIAITLEGKAVVSLQENNAFMTVDIASATIDEVKGLGVKRWDTNAKLDFSNKDGIYSPKNVPQLVGLYMPDTVIPLTVNGETYIISANEGDGREYIWQASQQSCDNANHEWDEKKDYSAGGGDEDASLYATELGDCIAYTDEARGKDLNAVASAHPLSPDSQGEFDISDDDNSVGRIKVVYDNHDTVIAADDDILTFGARSFSIWNMDTELIYDSGDDLSKRANSTANWNAHNDNNDASETNDSRSDDKGIEPEAVEVAYINGEAIAFIGLESQGGIAAYNVTNPESPVFLDYINNRNFNVDVCTAVDDGDCDNGVYNEAAGDLGPESIEYFSRDAKHYIAVGNEVSGTTTVYEITMN